MSPLAERPVDLAAERAVTEPTVISPLKKERPETWTDAVAVVVGPRPDPVTDEATDPAVAIEPSPGNARLPLADPFGPATAPAVAPPMPGAETEMPNASALGVPALVADGAPAEPVSARTASSPSRSEFLLTTAPEYWQAATPASGPLPESENHYHLAVAKRSRERQTEYRGLSLPGRTRLTAQRRALLELIADRKGSFTALDLFEEARRESPGLGLATVYRTVDLLRRTGSVRQLAGDARPAYVRCEPGHHHHLVCLSCGAVEETELCGAPSPSVLHRRYGFRAEGHELDIYGTCARCA